MNILNTIFFSFAQTLAGRHFPLAKFNARNIIPFN
jgi:hypothetical protein